jgi:hypothetical protein
VPSGGAGISVRKLPVLSATSVLSATRESCTLLSGKTEVPIEQTRCCRPPGEPASSQRIRDHEDPANGSDRYDQIQQRCELASCRETLQCSSTGRSTRVRHTVGLGKLPV